MTTRRQFLVRAAAAAGAAAGASLPGCAPDYGPAPYVDVPAPVDGRIPLALESTPDLARPGGAIIVRGPGISPPVLVVHGPGGGFSATGALCTHQGCPLGVEGAEIVCPCHLSRFDLGGGVLHPPARAGLPVFGAELDPQAGVVTVDLRAGEPGFPSVVDGQVVLPFAEFPALATPGGWVVGRPGGYGRPIVVVALPGGGHAAADAVCPHLQCTVGFSPGSGELLCPCHGSRFTTGGDLLQGPATRGLASFPAVTGPEGVAVAIG